MTEVFKNFWLKNGEVSWRNEDFGIFDKNSDFVNSKFRPLLTATNDCLNSDKLGCD